MAGRKAQFNRPMEDKMFVKKLNQLLCTLITATLFGGCTAAPILPVEATVSAGATSTPTSDTWIDNFDGALAPDWSWVDEDPSHWNLTEMPGMLRIVTQGESLYRAGKPRNLLLRDAPATDFEILTKVTFDPQANFQQAAILIYQDDGNFVLLNRGFCSVGSCPGSGIFLDNVMNGKRDEENSPQKASSLQTTWLRLRKEGIQYIGFYSADGQTWEELGPVDNPLTPSKVGLMANNSNADPGVPQIPADFDSFTVQGITLSTDTSLNVITEIPTTNASMALRSDQILAKINVGHLPFRLAIGEGSVWIANSGDETVSRIDPQTNQVVATIKVGKKPLSIAVGAGAVWVANNDDGTISQIDPQSNQVIATIQVGPNPRNVAFGLDSIWVTHDPDTVLRIDPNNNQIVATIKITANPTQIIVGGGAVWFAGKGGTQVSRIDPLTNEVVANIDVGYATIALAIAQGSIWVTGNTDPRVTRIDPASNQVVTQIDLASSSWGIAATEDAVWVTTNGNDTLSKIDPKSNEVVSIFEVGSGPVGIVVGDGALWVANTSDNTVWRIKP
jgi:YVTN family beta-propeller protein